MNDRQKQAFDFALDTTKQVVGLATGVLALTVTFLKDVASAVDAGTQAFMILAWIAFLLSVILGVASMMALTGDLGASRTADGQEVTPSVYSMPIRIMSGAQLVTFLFGMFFAVAFAIRSI